MWTGKENELKPLELALPASFRVGDKCCHYSICNHCFNSCNELCKQGTVWAMPAGGTADPYLVLKASNAGTDYTLLGQKLALVLLAHPIGLFTLLHSQSPCCSCNLKSIYLPNPHAKWYFLPPYSPFLLLLQYTLLQEWAYCPHGIFFPASHLPW